MTTTSRFALVALLATAGAAFPQETAEKPKPIQARGTPLRLQIVYSRYQGDKKVSSVPHQLSVIADEGPSRLRMGIMVPIQTQSKDGPSTQYRDVGNNIDCTARTLEPGLFRLQCSFEQSSLYDKERDPAALPMFRVFRSESNVALRDGQSTQHTSATDPVSGEVLKIDITLNVVK